MKMKEIGPRGGGPWSPPFPLDLPMSTVNIYMVVGPKDGINPSSYKRSSTDFLENETWKLQSSQNAINF